MDRRNIGYKTPALLHLAMWAMGGGGMVGVDGAEHSRLRGLVATAFTPRAIEKLQTWIAEMTEDLLDKAAAKSAKEGQVDLIAEFALPLPLNVISEMVGVPVAERWDAFKRADQPAFGSSDVPLPRSKTRSIGG